MTIDEAKNVLKANRVRPDAYSIGCDNDESYVALEVDGRWTVFYSQRGLRTGVKECSDVSSAMNRLVELVLDDSSTKI